MALLGSEFSAPPQPAGSTADQRRTSPAPQAARGLWVIFAAALGLCLFGAGLGLRNTLYSDLHSFRQTQTALNCQTMLQHGVTPDYELPVFGLPWNGVVFEFPLYQWIVVGVTRATHLPLEVAGREVSVAFFLLTLIPLYLGLAAMRVARVHRLIFLSLLAASPFYIFWSRTFMIESTALFFCASYAACVMLYAWRRERGDSIARAGYLAPLAVVFGAVGAIVKITTFPAFGLATVIYVYRDQLRHPLSKPNWPKLRRQTLLLLVTGGIPVFAAALWTHHADTLKAASPLGHYLMSKDPSMVRWNFGTLHQKLSPHLWKIVLSNARGTLINYDMMFWLGIIAIAIVTRRRWKEAVACVLLYLTAPAIFTNLHNQHEYYAYANAIFVLMGIGFCVLGIFETPGGARAGIVTMLVLLAGCAFTYKHMFYPLQRHNNTTLTEALAPIDAQMPSDAVILCLGLDYDSTIPYVSRHRALMIPPWGYLSDADLRKSLDGLHGYPVGPLFVGSDIQGRPLQSVLPLLAAEGISPSSAYSVTDRDRKWTITPLKVSWNSLSK